KGVASKLKGLGARVIVCEVDPIKALEAVMDGFEVKTMDEASKIGDIFITVTGNINVISSKHINNLKDGAILANAGHFNVEIDVAYLESKRISKRLIRDNLEEYIMPDGKHIYLIAEGRLANLVAAEGHPADVMDMSFANQALALEYLANRKNKLQPGVYDVLIEID
ncbi:MAG: adenosylhomocysteinase, partial [Dictyoglomus sp.]